MAKTPSALVVDLDVQARYEMRQLVKASGLTVAGEAGYGMESLTTAQEVLPDVIFIGVNEPMERPLQSVQQLAATFPDTPLIIYSDSKEIETARKAMLAGARDFLTRPIKPEVLRQSVLKAMEAAEQRRLSQAGANVAPPTQGTIVTIFGAKGGIGKSTAATNVAVALARQGKGSVCIVDLDNGFGDVAGMLDVKPERTILDLVRDVANIDKEALRKYVVQHPVGLDVLVGPSVLEWRSITSDQVRAVIELLARNYDSVVLDTSGMLTELSELAIEMATIVLWITTTEFASVKDSLEALRALRQLGLSEERIRIVTNAITPDDGVRPSAVEEAFQREVFWSIPYDRKVRQGTHLGAPIVLSSPQSVAAKSFTDLATLIAGGRIEQGRKVFGNFRWRPGAQPAPAEA